LKLHSITLTWEITILRKTAESCAPRFKGYVPISRSYVRPGVKIAVLAENAKSVNSGSFASANYRHAPPILKNMSNIKDNKCLSFIGFDHVAGARNSIGINFDHARMGSATVGVELQVIHNGKFLDNV
jgi:hypothetical protein